MDSYTCQIKGYDERPIGIFDSGVGGLTILQEVRRILPNENIVYFGDTKRVPYGDKSEDAIKSYTNQIVDFLLENNVKAIVIACNTITAICLEELKKTLNIPIIGVIDGGVNDAIEKTTNKKIGIMATKATVMKKEYTRKIQLYNKEIKVYEQACPLLCPLIEEGYGNEDFMEIIVEKYFSKLLSYDVDTVVLACTHFPILLKFFDKIKKGIKVVNPAFNTVQYLKKTLLEEGISNNLYKGEYLLYCSGDVEFFNSMASVILREDVNSTKLIDLERNYEEDIVKN